MKKFLKSLNVYYLTAAISISCLIVVFLCLIPLYFNGWMEIPQGIALGCLISSLFFFILGLMDRGAKEKLSNKGTIVVFIVRFIVFACILAFTGWLYYRQNIKIFNVFALVGGYIFPIVVLLILLVTVRKADENV